MRLRAGDLEAVVEGGTHLGVTSLRHRGEELLVSADALPEPFRVHGARAGITLLHPWANRLAPDVAVPDGAPRDQGGLPIHGLPLEWQLGREWAHADVAFPAAHRVVVSFTLDGGALTVSTRVEARDEPVPIAFGWHPYVRLPGAARADWRLGLPVRRRLTLDDRGLPTGEAAEEAPEDAPLGERVLDEGYDGLPAGATFGLAGGGRVVRVVLDRGYPAAQVFAPAEVDVVSQEPMTALTNALGAGTAPTIAAGETFEAVFRVVVSA